MKFEVKQIRTYYNSQTKTLTSFKQFDLQSKMGNSPRTAEKRYFAIYPQGLGDIVLYELRDLLGVEIIEHFQRYNVILFKYGAGNASDRLPPLTCAAVIEEVSENNSFCFAEHVPIEVQYRLRGKHSFNNKKRMVVKHDEGESLDPVRSVMQTFFSNSSSPSNANRRGSCTSFSTSVDRYSN